VRITRVELFDLTIPFVEPFIISGGRIDARRSLIVALHDDAGHVGYGESPRSSSRSTPRRPSPGPAT